jgi:hypothetical protein
LITRPGILSSLLSYGAAAGTLSTTCSIPNVCAPFHLSCSRHSLRSHPQRITYPRRLGWLDFHSIIFFYFYLSFLSLLLQFPSVKWIPKTLEHCLWVIKTSID